MRITVIGPVYPYRGGIAHFTTCLVQNLQAAGHQVKAISFRRQYPSWLYPGETDKDTSKRQLVVPALYLLDPLYPWTWMMAARQILRDKPDLLIIQWWTPFWAPAFAVLGRWMRSAGIPVVFLVHNVMPHEKRPWDVWLARIGLSAGQKFIVQTEKEAIRLRSLLPRANYVVTPHPIYEMFSDQRVEKEDARVKLKIPLRARVLLSFGIVRPYKGLKYLLSALAILKQKNEAEYHLIIAGEFWEPESVYLSQARALGIEDSVHIFNYYIPNEEIPVFFAAADVFAAPYIDGTQSGAVKMALGFDMPVILTQCILDETLAQRADISVVNDRDAEGLAVAIEDIFSNAPKIANRIEDNPWDQMVKVIELQA